MSRARNAIVADIDGMYRTWCDACDVEATFPTVAMAIAARKEHLCEGEVPSCAWTGWEAPINDEAVEPWPIEGVFVPTERIIVVDQ